MFRKLVDTNILYDAWTENENTSQALKVIDEPICILEGVLYELANLLKNTQGTNYACEVITEILDNPKVFKVLVVNKSDQIAALAIMKKYQLSEPKKDFSLVDSLQFVVAERGSLSLYTLDQRMTFFKTKNFEVIKPY